MLPDNYKHFASVWDSDSVDQKTLTSLNAVLIAEETRMNMLQKEQKPVIFKFVKKG